LKPEANFADRLTAAVHLHGPLCVGLDPYADRIPAAFGSGAGAVRSFCLAIVERCRGKVAAVKPQAALFECWGPEGYQALQNVCAAARAAGLLVILDAKRGDIGATAEGYAAAYLGENQVMAADCLTIAPYMGRDSLAPFLAAAKRTGRGVAILVRTSNPGAADFQALQVGSSDAGGAPLYERVAAVAAELGQDLIGQSGWSSAMFVVGATAPAEAARIRAIAPNNPFLVPGYGAQGGTAGDSLTGFRRTHFGVEGGLVSASRSVLFPKGAESLSGPAWETAINGAIAAARSDLQGAAAAA
jgi:orotidine-5'-phosphate decarboxylase